MSNKLGHRYVDSDGDVAYTCIYTGASDQKFAEGKEDLVRDYISNWGDEDQDLYEDDYSNISSEEEIIDEEDYLSEDVFNKQQERAKLVLAALKDIKGLDLNNLIVRGDRVISGYSECEEYIAASHVWLSSSMMC